MTETRGTHRDGTGATEDVQRLHDRIRELEQQLAVRAEPTGKAGNERAGNRGLKFMSAVLAALAVVMALPAFITIRRWVEWWR